MKKMTPKKKENMTIDDLAVMVAKGFSSMEEKFDTRFSNLEKDVSELKVDMKNTRKDILRIGDKFVQRYEFDTLLVRVGHLESEVHENKKSK